MVRNIVCGWVYVVIENDISIGIIFNNKIRNRNDVIGIRFVDVIIVSVIIVIIVIIIVSCGVQTDGVIGNEIRIVKNNNSLVGWNNKITSIVGS